MSNKGKEKMVNLGNVPKAAKSLKNQTYKSAIQKDEKTLRAEALKAIPEEEHLRDDAYKVAIASGSAKEYIYPYVYITTEWISPIERKYAHLSSEEVKTFYLKNFTDPYLFPKDFLFYQDILAVSGSVYFDPTTRSGGEWAYSKATIIRILTPEDWNGDLYNNKEFKYNNNRNKITFNYFDYQKAWEIAFCYENRQRKHSWFLQFREQRVLNFPTWFTCWFLNWGLYPLILPKKIRTVYDDFVETNPSMKLHTLMFAALYQVPWILRWDVVKIPRRFEKYGVILDEVPYLGRRIMIKWWEKYEFFKDSVFSAKGIINLEPVNPREPKKDVSEIIKDLLTSGSSKFSGSSKRELKKQLRSLLASDSSSEGEEDAQDNDSMSTEKSDPMLQDSQSP